MSKPAVDYYVIRRNVQDESKPPLFLTDQEDYTTNRPDAVRFKTRDLAENHVIPAFELVVPVPATRGHTGPLSEPEGDGLGENSMNLYLIERDNRHSWVVFAKDKAQALCISPFDWDEDNLKYAPNTCSLYRDVTCTLLGTSFKETEAKLVLASPVQAKQT